MKTTRMVVAALMLSACSSSGPNNVIATTDPAESAIGDVSTTASPKLTSSTEGSVSTSPAQSEPVRPTSTTRPQGPRPSVDSETNNDPVPLPELGPNIWLVQDWEKSDTIIAVNPEDLTQMILWQQDALGDPWTTGHSVACEDIDGDGGVDILDVHFSFEGTLRDTYREIRTFNGEVIADTSQPVDGTNVPSQVYEICSRQSTGPIRRITSMQWAAALHAAGFTDIEGDHPIDPGWAAGGRWKTDEYWPLGLYQGEFQPEATDTTEVLQCQIGTITIPRTLPADARRSLLDVSGC